jgi:hypothetical protein
MLGAMAAALRERGRNLGLRVSHEIPLRQGEACSECGAHRTKTVQVVQLLY